MQVQAADWKGWRFDGKYIVDPWGNKYHQNEVREIFFTRQLIRELTGSTLQVRSLKEELKRKIEAIQPPKIIIEYPDGSQKVISYTPTK